MTSKEHINKKRDQLLLISFVRWARLELAQDYSHYPLKVACLPFHHHRFFVLGLQRYALFFNFQTFLQFFCKNLHFFCSGMFLNMHKAFIFSEIIVFSILFTIFARFSSGRKAWYYFINIIKTDSQWLLKFVSSATVRRISHSSTLLWLIHAHHAMVVTSSSSALTTLTQTLQLSFSTTSAHLHGLT